MWWQKFLLYGCIGLLVEIFFTSLYSLINRHWKATGYTYWWMLFVYGPTGLLLECVSEAVRWPFYFKAFLYLPIIFGVEALSGYTLQKFTGLLQRLFGGTGGNTIPWEYAKSKWSPMGLINLKYTPYWYILALAFHPISVFLNKVVKLVVEPMVK